MPETTKGAPDAPRFSKGDEKMKRKTIFPRIGTGILALSLMLGFTACGRGHLTEARINDSFLPISESVSPSSAPAHPEILLVNAAHGLEEGDQAKDLINLYEQKDRHFRLMRADMMLCREVYEAMQRMFLAAEQAGMDGFLLTSAFRDREQQAQIYAQTTDGSAAAPGHSEHETGLAFDVAVAGVADFSTTPQYEWLRGHCADYGFILRYPQGKEDLTGIPFEPWHYRFVGVDAATEIMSRGLCLEEYVMGGH